MTDAGMKKLDCAFVSVLDEYNGRRRPGIVLHNVYILHILHILRILHILHILHILPFLEIFNVFHRVGGYMPVNHRL